MIEILSADPDSVPSSAEVNNGLDHTLVSGQPRPEAWPRQQLRTEGYGSSQVVSMEPETAHVVTDKAKYTAWVMRLTVGPLRQEVVRVLGSCPKIVPAGGSRRNPNTGEMQKMIETVVARGKRPWTTFPKNQKPY